MSPIVSVIMPAFNAGRYLAASIESALRQTFSDLEIIAVDDGSTDDTAAILDCFARADQRVQVFNRPHLGLGPARNFALAQARGEFMAVVDADDIAAPQRLALQVDYLRSHGDCVAVGGQGEQIDPDGDPLGPLDVRLTHEEIEAELLTGRGSAIVHSGATFRRHAVAEVNGYDERLPTGEDLDLYLKLAERGRLANLPERLMSIRRHTRSLTALYDGVGAHRIREEICRAACRRRGWLEGRVAVREFPQPQSERELFAVWALMALRARHYRTALKYTRRLISSPANDLALWTRLAWRAAAGPGARVVKRFLGERQ